MPRTKGPKIAAKVFRSDKVTKEDEKKVKPLTKYWAGRLKEARDSDNWTIFFVGVVFGSALSALAFEVISGV